MGAAGGVGAHCVSQLAPLWVLRARLGGGMSRGVSVVPAGAEVPGGSWSRHSSSLTWLCCLYQLCRCIRTWSNASAMLTEEGRS